MNEKLREKCRLNDKECREVEKKEGGYLSWNTPILDAQLEKVEPLIRKDERERMGQAFIDYLENEIKTVDKRTAGLPSFKAIECMVLQTVINALKEWQALKATEGKEG